MLYLGQQNWAILSADEIRQFLHDTRQIFVRRFCRQIKSANFVVHLTSPLLFPPNTDERVLSQPQSCWSVLNFLTPEERWTELTSVVGYTPSCFICPVQVIGLTRSSCYFSTEKLFIMTKCKKFYGNFQYCKAFVFTTCLGCDEILSNSISVF